MILFISINAMYLRQQKSFQQKRRYVLGLINLSTLILLGCIDFKSYRIPNEILCGWLGTILFIHHIGCTTPRIIISAVMGAFIVIGSYIPLRRIVKCSAGDFKLFAVLTVAIGVDDMLNILLFSLLIGLLPLACGVKKIPIAFVTCLGYIAFLIKG